MAVHLVDELEQNSQQHSSTLKPEDIYKPLSLVSTTLATNLAPFKYTRE
jgi:hypothetical protein